MTRDQANAALTQAVQAAIDRGFVALVTAAAINPEGSLECFDNLLASVVLAEATARAAIDKRFTNGPEREPTP